MNIVLASDRLTDTQTRRHRDTETHRHTDRHRGTQPDSHTTHARTLVVADGAFRTQRLGMRKVGLRNQAPGSCFFSFSPFQSAATRPPCRVTHSFWRIIEARLKALPRCFFWRIRNSPRQELSRILSRSTLSRLVSGK